MKKPCKQGCTNGVLSYGPGLSFECICAKRARVRALKATLNRGAIVGAANVPAPEPSKEDVTSYATMDLPSLCRAIRRNWPAMPESARAYFEPLASLDNLGQDYGMDSGRSVALYFLSNAKGFRGPVAKACKARLQALLKEGGRRA